MFSLTQYFYAHTAYFRNSLLPSSFSGRVVNVLQWYSMASVALDDGLG